MSQLPTELWAVHIDKYRAYARFNPILNSWAYFEMDDVNSAVNKGEPKQHGLAYLDVLTLLKKRGHVIRQDFREDLPKISRRYGMVSFGEVVLGLASSTSADVLLKSLFQERDYINNLPDKLFEYWLDSVGTLGFESHFWKKNGQEVFWDIVAKGDRMIRNLDQVPNDDDLLAMFNTALYNLSYGAATNKSSKAFIQKAIGIGFLGRAFGL